VSSTKTAEPIEVSLGYGLGWAPGIQDCVEWGGAHRVVHGLGWPTGWVEIFSDFGGLGCARSTVAKVQKKLKGLR